MSAKRVACDTVNLTPYYNWSGSSAQATDQNESDAKHFGGSAEYWCNFRNRFASMPTGVFESWGVPFALAATETSPCAIALKTGDDPVSIPLSGKASHLSIAHCYAQYPEAMCGDDPPREGMLVAEYTITYENGETHTRPIRARFEVDLAESPGPPWLCQEFRGWTTVDPTAIPVGQTWGAQQYALQFPFGGGMFPLFHYALDNPHPDRGLKSISMSATTECPLFVSAITHYRGTANPLRHLPRHALRITRPDGKPAIVDDATVDFGTVARVERTQTPRDQEWLDSGFVGVNRGDEPSRDAEDILHVVAADDATISVKLEDESERRDFNIGETFDKGSSTSGDHKLEVLGKDHQWMTVRVLEESNGIPTPVRIHFSDAAGRYIAPHGHHEQINTNWFEDYGADIQVGGRNHAYVNGEFTVDLPVGDVFVEIVKGFEYQPIRQKITVKPGEKKLDLSMSRCADWRSEGWVTADTHVHFISPHTAWLEAAAEGVNVVNLLASQWGRLFTNVGDVTGKVGVVEDDTIVYVGTENRNHMLGHMSMLGTQGNLPVYPICGGGPTESWIGDPDFRSLAEWAQENRQKGGVVIRPHFPYCGNSEDPVSVLMGLVDALEIATVVNNRFPVQEWYRYLNLGYRVAVCGGTDKMSANNAVGWTRTYAKLDSNTEFNYDAWGDAVRAGRTFSTTGPLIDISVDGQPIGGDISMGVGGGTVEVHAHAQSFIPMGGMEIVLNGKVVAKIDAPDGSKNLDITERVKVPGSGWIAARCFGLAGHAGGVLAAHTSPVYVKCGDQRAFDGPAAEHMLSLIDGSTEYLNQIATVYDEESRNRMVKLFNEARAELHGRLIVERKG
jgi:hypothetical protein